MVLTAQALYVARPRTRTASAAHSPLLHTVQLQDKHDPLSLTEEPAGISHSELAITPPAWPCFIYPCSNKFPREHPSCLTVEMMNKAVSLLEIKE